MKMSKDSRAKYYKNNKERLQKKLVKDIKEEKEKKRLYVCEQYKNPPEDEKQKLVEYRKNTMK